MSLFGSGEVAGFIDRACKALERIADALEARSGKLPNCPNCRETPCLSGCPLRNEPRPGQNQELRQDPFQPALPDAIARGHALAVPPHICPDCGMSGRVICMDSCPSPTTIARALFPLPGSSI